MKIKKENVKSLWGPSPKRSSIIVSFSPYLLNTALSFPPLLGTVVLLFYSSFVVFLVQIASDS